MKIVITGNMGYVGPGVVRHLRSVWPDAELVGYDLGFFAHSLTGAAVLPEVLLDRQVIGDVRAFPGSLLEGADAVVHLAAVSNDPIGNAYEQVTIDVNQKASVAVARAAREAGVGSFVFASSCSVYGAADDSARTEESTTGPITAYARSKVGAEGELAELADDDFAVTSLRFATACGMSDRLRLDLVLNDFVASALATGTISILSDGSPWRPLIHVRDMALAIEWAVSRAESDPGPYLVTNVGRNDFNVQVRDLAAVVADQIPGTEVTIKTDAAPDKRSYQVNFDKFAALAPNHTPRYTVEAAVADLRDGLTAMGFADPDFRNSPLMRLHTLERLRSDGLVTENLTWARGAVPATTTV